MSHTINQQHAASRSVLHPQQRGVSSHMPPPSRPASQQTARPFSTVLPPHINARHTLPVPNPDPVYAPPQSYASAPINPADYSNSTGMVDHPNGVGVPVQYTNRNFQANLGLDGRSGAETVPGYSGNDSTHYYLPGDNDDLPDVISPPRSPPATNEPTREVSYSPDDQADASVIHPEVDHAMLQAFFRLSEADLSLAKSILVMSKTNITGALIYGLVAQRRVTHENLPDNPTQTDEVVAPADPPVPNEQVDVRNFLYSDYIKDEIRDFIRRKMIESRMVAYSRHLDDDGVPEPRALLTMTQAHVASLPAHIRRQHLPPGFAAGNNHARRSVLQLVRNLLKHDRVLLRNMLLRNIIDTSHARVRAGGVPSLQMLYTSIHTNFLENSGVHAPRVNWEMLPMRIKVRFAYLRLETAAHTFRNSQRHGSQWTPIDEQLALLTTKSMDYVRAWANAIIALDSQIFGTGGVVFADVRHLVVLPTDEAIQDTLVTNELLPTAERPQQPVMEDDLFNMDA